MSFNVILLFTAWKMLFHIDLALHFHHTGFFPSQFRMQTLLFAAFKMLFSSCQMVYLFHDFQHMTKNCQTHSSFSRVENHAVEIKNYCDENEMSD